MTVAELIDQLKKYNLGDEVVVSFPANNYASHKIHEVEPWVEIKEGRRAVSVNAIWEEIDYDGE